MRFRDIAEAKKPRKSFDITQTPQFRRWFGDSKVVDRWGRPLRCYHGTRSDFDTFSDEDTPYRGGLLAFFSTNPKFASAYASDERHKEVQQGAVVMPVYLRIINPFDYRTEGRVMAADFYAETGGLTDKWEQNRILMGLGFKIDNIDDTTTPDLTEEQFVKAVVAGSWDALEAPEFVHYLRQAGYDGIVMRENGSVNYGIFKPEQVKSATANREFSRYSPNITEAVLLEKHADIIQALEPYRDDPSIFVTFSDIEKVGINPQSPWDTPIGIYAYPLREMWRNILDDKIPFAGDRKFAHVLRATGPGIVDVDDYTRDDLRRDYPKLVEIYNEIHAQHGWTNQLETDMAQWLRDAEPKRVEAAKLWNVTRHLAGTMSMGRTGHLKGSGAAKSSTVEWNVILRRLGYRGFTDREGTGLIHRNEPVQAVFLEKGAVQQVATLRNVRRTPHETVEIDNIFELRNVILRPSTIVPTNWSFDRKERIPYHAIREWPTLMIKGVSPNFQIRYARLFFGEDFGKGFMEFFRTILDREYPLLPRQIAGAIAVAEQRPQVAASIAAAAWGMIHPRVGGGGVAPFMRVMLDPRYTSFIQAHFQYIDPNTDVPIAVAAAQRAVAAVADILDSTVVYGPRDEIEAAYRAVLAPYWSRLLTILGQDGLESEIAACIRVLAGERHNSG